jgi:hypothetical protein
LQKITPFLHKGRCCFFAAGNYSSSYIAAHPMEVNYICQYGTRPIEHSASPASSSVRKVTD